MSEKQHSKLAPSSAQRWLHCSGSVLLPQFNEEKDTSAADEGTLVHTLAEIKLDRDETSEKELQELRSDPLYHPVMEHYTDNYAEFINDKDADEMLVEEILDLSFIYPNLFGTSDCILMNGGKKPKLEVVDLKYGKWFVNPENNPQLMLYALGAVKLFQKRFIGVPDNFPVILTIYQPRIKNISSWETDFKALSEWCSTVLMPALSRISYEVIEENTGEWCRFCPARIFCHEYNDVYIGFDPEDIKAMSDSEIEEKLAEIEEVEKYLKTLKSYISSRIKAGTTFSRYKLVAGRKKRFWENEEGLKKALIENGDYENALELISPAQLEKKIDKDKYSEFVGTQEGNPMLVKREDKRKELEFEN